MALAYNRNIESHQGEQGRGYHSLDKKHQRAGNSNNEGWKSLQEAEHGSLGRAMSREEVGTVPIDKQGTAEAESRLIAAPRDHNHGRDDALALACRMTIPKEWREVRGQSATIAEK
ncbi:uncharacterized protein N7458_006943 [Penicillium daleae]|uniref:Uncharacterized protein n=1 Tax=Penicillium daleae TaxID=63821 RepID=A0AAD6C688_9EURO|nr:uncharacterized protein N7458_006943 [Penicillium daleae]KAJ5450494.1 hypothetical protein N7458_006943 [Penicillium daleae]